MIGIDRNREYESEEMQEELALEDLYLGDDEHESFEGSSNSGNSSEGDSNHLDQSGDEEVDNILENPLNAQVLNVQGNILDGFDAFSPTMLSASQQELEESELESESEGEEINSKKRVPSRSPSSINFKKYRSNEHDREGGGQGV